ncbi:MAG: hypothetical protein JWM20_835 [Patescibacteria group bacterium]|nr:hypothetical protein [Patescibacteria group bacterium]
MNEPIYVIGYARVSTAKQAVGGDSLAGQEQDIRNYCDRNGYTLFPDNKVFEEPFSGKTKSRPVYNEIIQILKDNPGKVKFLIIRIISRMTRGKVDNYYEIKSELLKHGTELRDVTGIIQAEKNHFDKYNLKYEWSTESPSEASELMEVKRSEMDRKRILRQLIEAQILLVRDGYHMGPANDGYVSKKVDVDMKKRYILEPDPERSKYYSEMFRLRAEGIYSDEEIVSKINAMGFKSKVRKKWNNSKTKITGKTESLGLTVKTLQRIITRPIYCGIVCEKWTNYLPIKGKWNGIVSMDIFNKANRGKVYINSLGENRFEILYDQKLEKFLDKRHDFRPDFPFKNILKCPLCGKPLLGSFSTGKLGNKYPAYHCSRKHERYAFPRKEAEDTFNNFLATIKFTDEFISIIERALVYKYRREEGTVADKSNFISKRILEIKEQKQLKLRAIEAANSPIVKADLEKEYESIHIELSRAQNERNKLDINEDQIHEFIKNTKDLMEHPTKILENIENKREQITLYSLFFEEFPTYEEIVSRTPKLTFIFKINEEKLDEKSLTVRRQGIEP